MAWEIEAHLCGRNGWDILVGEAVHLMEKKMAQREKRIQVTMVVLTEVPQEIVGAQYLDVPPCAAWFGRWSPGGFGSSRPLQDHRR